MKERAARIKKAHIRRCFCSSGQQSGEQLLEENKEQLRPSQETREELPRSG